MALTSTEKSRRNRLKNGVKTVCFTLRREQVEILKLLQEGETAPQLAKKLFFNEMEKRKNEN